MLVFKLMAGIDNRIAGNGGGVAVGTGVGVSVGRGVAGGNSNTGVLAMNK